MHGHRTLGGLTPVKDIGSKEKNEAVVSPAIFIIPPEILLEILKYLTKHELLRFSMVCTTFNLLGVPEKSFEANGWSRLDYSRPLIGSYEHASPKSFAAIRALFPLPNGDLVIHSAYGSLMHFDFRTQTWQTLETGTAVDFIVEDCFLFQRQFLVINIKFINFNHSGTCQITIWDKNTRWFVQSLLLEQNLKVVGYKDELKTIRGNSAIQIWKYASEKSVDPFELKSVNRELLNLKLKKLDGHIGIFKNRDTSSLLIWNFENDQLIAEWTDEKLKNCLPQEWHVLCIFNFIDWAFPTLPGYVTLRVAGHRYLLNLNNIESRPVDLGYELSVTTARVTSDGDYVVLQRLPDGFKVSFNWCPQKSAFDSYSMRKKGLSDFCGISKDGNIFVCNIGFFSGAVNGCILGLSIWNKQSNKVSDFLFDQTVIYAPIDFAWLPSGDLLFLQNQNPSFIIDGVTGTVKYSFGYPECKYFAPICDVTDEPSTRRGLVCVLADGSFAVNWESKCLVESGSDKELRAKTPKVRSQFSTAIYRFAIWKDPAEPQTPSQTAVQAPEVKQLKK